MRDQLLFKTGSHVLSSILWEPHSSPTASEPILAYPGHHLAFWAPSPQFLVASHGQVFRATPHYPISSPRSAISQNLASIGPECSSFMSSLCPPGTYPDELTCEPSARCSAPLISLVHQATPPPTSLRADFWHGFNWNYFHSEFTSFITMYLPREVTQSGSIHIKICLQRKRPSWGTNQRPEIIFIFLAVIGSAICSFL